MATPDTVTLVSLDGENEITLPLNEPHEITNLRALGWATKPEQKAAAKAADAK